ncbi:SGNH/GDSL hydrolase family protein [Paenibacillus sp. OAS669]|uniref:SGNH/GDSL hydrolase family protein n=1 Tax=Paenibacillus sp. OAS669 TaxID=2663821 RepID=UPI001789F243|nr:SGNH/GDSL hydrolase family protein [Paenibacillus sp. OAS669]MBE1444022.1 lysophospholipase L1-like esterase [Paenibacillus sp. OAS669]
MRIEEIAAKGLFANAIRWIHTEEGLMPVRFTERQMELYSREERFHIRSHCPAGICLDFVSDTTSIEINYSLGSAVRKWANYDIYIDGVMAASLGADTLEQDLGRIAYELHAGMQNGQPRRWTIYLPQNTMVAIQSLKLSEGAAVEAAEPYKRNLLCLGDSITQGMDARKPSSTYAVLLSRALEMNLLNHGVGGYVFDADSLDESLPYKPDLVTVAYGTNDWGRFETLDVFRRQCFGFIDKAAKLYAGVPIYVLTPYWRADQDKEVPMGTMQELSDTIREVCQPYSNITVVDGQKLIPHLPTLFGDAYLHPNDEGFLHIAMNLFKQIAANGHC